MKAAKRYGLALVFMAVFFVFASAALDTKFYGYQWLRYTDVVTGMDVQGASGLSIPRTYLRWKMEDKDAGWAGELTLDINNVKGGQEVSATAVSYTSTAIAGKLDFAIWPKYAYVDFTKIPGLSDMGVKLRVGQQKNYFGTVELWEYPLIEKTITDLRKVCSSADLGAALLGEIPEGFGQYELAIHNGSGYKLLDANVEKQYSASVMVLPITGLMLRGSYMSNNSNAYGLTAKTKAATDVVAQYTYGPFQVLAEYVAQKDAAAASASKTGVSVGYMFFAKYDVFEWLQAAFRFDNWNPDTKTKNDETNLYIAGVNIKANENILVQLNYQFEQPMYGGYTQSKHVNTLMAQVKWGW